MHKTMTRKHKKYSVLIGLVAVMLTSGTAYGKFFENLSKGGRSLGVGGAYVAGQGVEAIYYNPAQMLTVKGLNVVANVQPGIAHPDMMFLSTGAVYNLGSLAVGGYFNMQNLAGYVGETTLVAGAGLDLSSIFKGIFKNFYAGANLRMYLLSKEFSLGLEGEQDSWAGFSADIGISIAFNDNLTLGLAVINLLAPNMTFFSGGEGEATNREIRIGIKWELNEFFRMYADYADYPAPDVEGTTPGLHIGGEMEFYKVFLLRLGIDEGELCIGIGLVTPTLNVDLAFKVQGEMGLYYQTGLTLKL